jgi:hypothetical protein
MCLLCDRVYKFGCAVNFVRVMMPVNVVRVMMFVDINCATPYGAYVCTWLECILIFTIFTRVECLWLTCVQVIGYLV